MNYHNISHDDQNNGDGLRVVLWVSGCSHHCYKCQNQQTWKEDSGINFDNNAFKEIVSQLKQDYISGLTLSGGDPLNISNIQDINVLIKIIKSAFPNKTIWMYTGYTWEELLNKYNEYKYTTFAPNADEWLTRFEILSLVDVLVDGRYVDELKDITLKWRGSSNQRVIDVQESLKQNKVVLYCD